MRVERERKRERGGKQGNFQRPTRRLMTRDKDDEKG